MWPVVTQEGGIVDTERDGCVPFPKRRVGSRPSAGPSLLCHRMMNGRKKRSRLKIWRG